MIDEIDGVIKYKTDLFTQKSISPLSPIEDIEFWRHILFQVKMIGEFSHGVGFVNISKRFPVATNQFLITATQTGAMEFLNSKYYTHVTKFNLLDFTISMQGTLKASSEALTHAAIYAANSKVNYIFHIHHRKMWEMMRTGDFQKIPASISYGTTEMAAAFAELTKDNKSGIIVMAGHQDGILAYGESANQAGCIILETFQKLRLS